jgi:hypothetical protein
MVCVPTPRKNNVHVPEDGICEGGQPTPYQDGTELTRPCSQKAPVHRGGNREGNIGKEYAAAAAVGGAAAAAIVAAAAGAEVEGAAAVGAVAAAVLETATAALGGEFNCSDRAATTNLIWHTAQVWNVSRGELP